MHNTLRKIQSLKYDLRWDEMDLFSHGLLMADIYSSLQSQLPINYHFGYSHKIGQR